MKTSRYTAAKERARQEAKDWQAAFSERSHDYQELAEAAAKFTRLGRRYGLLQEFRENGII